MLFVHLDGAPGSGTRDDLAGALAVAAGRGVHAVFVASGERTARRVLGLGWDKLARHILVMHAAGYTGWPVRTRFRPDRSRAALVDNGTGVLVTVLLRSTTQA